MEDTIFSEFDIKSLLKDIDLDLKNKFALRIKLKRLLTKIHNEKNNKKQESILKYWLLLIIIEVI